ncbi:MAG: acetolactate synthase small subunit [Peptoniphilus sp.]|uniref:acetolactate synthase small subunit n=1 Tax=Peptoniphilus sp. TaxID=1971214 RepID=UPI0025CE4A63|nr:acetolactate synthase small subunit [Peptoniphilus sp.]MCI5642550.1 acetolactate synthase small subunit [Peptoniphilus sp.]MDD7352168.1 acetolactate synthase small subunit [Peptoniphilaceae bacterium]MDY3902292.1 acetolactate synthase small subunit [Peptoniphilus sp.]
MKYEVLSLLVDNQSGTLTRIASLFARRGYNIESLTVSAVKDSKYSKITITTIIEDKHELKQIVSQCAKLEVVRDIEIITKEEVVQREICLVKIKCKSEKAIEVVNIANIYKANIVDFSKDSLIVEITGKPAKVDAFLRVIESYEIIDFCRTGITAMKR